MATVTSSKRHLVLTSDTYTSNGDVVVGGDLTIQGTTTTLDTANLLVEDKNIIIGNVSSPSDTTADGGGITLKGASDKTISWSNANNRWDFNQGITSSGNITAANISGSTSGTNTGDQDLSGYATTSHNHDGRYLRTHARYSDDLDTIGSSGVYIWDVSEADDEPTGAADGLLTIKYWDSSYWATASFQDFHNRKLYIKSKKNGTWQTDWAQVWTTDQLTTTNKTNYDTAYTHSQATHAPTDAEANVQADWTATSGDAFILNKPTIPPDYGAHNGVYLKTNYRANWIRVGYGNSGGVRYHKLATIVIPSSYVDYNATFDWTGRYASGTAGIHLHSDANTTAVVYGAWYEDFNPTKTLEGTNGWIKYTKSGDTVEIWIKTSGWREFDYIQKDSVTEGSPTVTWYDENTTTDQSTEPSNLNAFTNRTHTAAGYSTATGVADNAEVNVQADWTATSGDALILNKPTIPTDHGDHDGLYLPIGGGDLTGDLTIDNNAPRIDFKSDESGSNVGGRIELNENGNLWVNAQGGKDLWLNWYSPNSESSKADLAVGDGDSGGAILFVDGSERKVGINDTTPSEALDVNGNIAVTGTVDGVDISALPTTFAPTDAEANVNADWTSTSGDSQILNNPGTSYLTGVTDRHVFPGLAASGTQARRHHIGRVYYCPKHWDTTWQNIYFTLNEETYNSGYIKYHLFGYYNGTNDQTLNLRVVDYRGNSGDINKYKIVLGDHTDAGWDHSSQNVYYTDIYIEVAYYKSVKVVVDALGHPILHSNPTSGAGITVIYETPTITNITYTNATYNTTYLGSNTIIWNSANDGAGSGLDADTVDGTQASLFKRINGEFLLDVNDDYDTETGTWSTGTSTSWGEPNITGGYAYNDGTGSRTYDVPTGAESCWISHLTWSSGGYVDVLGVQSDGGEVFLRRINTHQAVQNSDEGAGQHDGSTITFAGTSLSSFGKIKFKNRNGRFHLTGIVFSSSQWEGTEGTGMIHPKQITQQGSGNGLDSDKLDGQQGTYYLDYNNFTNTPTIPTVPDSYAPTDAEANVQADWTETTTTSDAYILNKPATFAPSAHDHDSTYVKLTSSEEQEISGDVLFNDTVQFDGDVQNITSTTAVNIQTTGGAMLVLKDTNSAGVAANPYINFVDSSNTRVGYIGIGSTGNSKLYLEGLGGIQTNNPLSVTGSLTVSTTGNFAGKVNFQGDAAIEGGSGYGVFKGYTGNDNHFISVRGIVANTSTTTITGGHQTTFVEHADESNEGWYFKSKTTGTYREIARIDGTNKMYLGGNEVWNAGNDGSGSGLDADTVDGSHANLSYGAGKQYDFTVNGNADVFYPVVISGMSSPRMTRLTVYRSYSETAPSTWNTSTHKGGLTLDMDVRVGGWGGYPNMINVHDFGEIYSRICGGAAYTAHTMKFVIWLRGGTASYHIDSPNKNLSIEVNDNTSASNYVTGSTGNGSWYSYTNSNTSYNVTVSAKDLSDADIGAKDLLVYMPIRYNGSQNKVISGVSLPTSLDANNANTLDNLDSTEFLRSNTADTASSKISFTASESIGFKGARGGFTNEYIHLYNKVGIGHPSGWGQGEADTPATGLSTYGGASLSYGTKAESTVHGNLNVGSAADTGNRDLYLHGSTANKKSRLRTTNGNLHIDSADGNSLYLNYYYGAGTNIYFGTGNGGYCGTVSSAGILRMASDVVAYYSFSDRRLKTNIKTTENNLDKILSLNPVEYTWKEGPREGVKEIGLIAQEVEEVVPEVVRVQSRHHDEKEEGEEYKQVDYEHLVSTLIGAMQEQQKQIDELKSQISVFNVKKCKCKK